MNMIFPLLLVFFILYSLFSLKNKDIAKIIAFIVSIIVISACLGFCPIETKYIDRFTNSLNNVSDNVSNNISNLTNMLGITNEDAEKIKDTLQSVDWTSVLNRAAETIKSYGNNQPN